MKPKKPADAVKICFIVPVWGQWYVDLFLTLGMPSLLAGGNIPALKNRNEHVFLIYTDTEFLDTFREAEPFRILSKHINTKLIDIASLPEEMMSNYHLPKKYSKMTRCHNHAIAEYSKQGYAFAFIQPDNLFCDNTYNRLEDILNEGYRVVLTPGLILNTDTLVPEILETVYNKETHQVSMTARQSHEIGFRHLHPLMYSCFADSPTYYASGHIYFYQEGEGVFIRMFYYHPMAVRPKNADYTVSPDLTCDSCPIIFESAETPDEVYIVNDSDDLTIFALDPTSERNYPEIRQKNRFNIFEFANWIAGRQVNPHFHQVFMKGAYIHYGEIDRLREAERSSLQTAKDCFFWTKSEGLFFKWDLLSADIMESWTEEKSAEYCLGWIKTAEKYIESVKPDERPAFLSDTAAVKQFLAGYAANFQEIINNPEISSKVDILMWFREVLSYLGNGEAFSIEKFERLKKAADTAFASARPKRLAIYAAGDDTKYLLKIYPKLRAYTKEIYDDSPKNIGTQIFGLDICSSSKIDESKSGLDAVLISSTLYEDKIYERIAHLENEGIKIIRVVNA